MAVQLKTLTEVTVAQPGQKQAIYSQKLMVYSVSVQSLSTNTGSQYIGDSSLTSDNGQVFGPSDVAELDGPPSAKGQEQFDVSSIFVDSSTAGAKFRVSVWIRE
jgi:hypothetical protein